MASRLITAPLSFYAPGFALALAFLRTAGGSWVGFPWAKSGPMGRFGLCPSHRTSPPRLSGIKIGAKVVAHSRYVVFQMADVAVPKRLFRAVLGRTGRLQLPETVPA